MSKKTKRKNLTRTELSRKLFKDLYKKKTHRNIKVEDYIKAVRKGELLEKKVIGDKLDQKHYVTFIVSLLTFKSSILDKMVVDKIKKYTEKEQCMSDIVRVQVYKNDTLVAVEWTSWSAYKKHTKNMKNFYPEAQNELVSEYLNSFEGGFKEAYDKMIAK